MSDQASLARLLGALAVQEGLDAPLDVRIADRTGLARADEPGVHLLSAPADTSVFALRRRALEASTAEIVIVTEDHCVPGPGWVRALTQALRADPEAVAASGPVHDGLNGDPWDRAAFLCDYGGLLPDGSTVTHRVSALPGMNTAYRRDALVKVLRSEPHLFDDFWEAGVHRRLARDGHFVVTPAADLAHCKRFGRRLALDQRYLQARHVAGTRAADLGLVGRVGWTLAATALPATLIPRVFGPSLRRSGLPARRLAATLPALLALVGAWTLGEVVGAALGPGDALVRVE